MRPGLSDTAFPGTREELAGYEARHAGDGYARLPAPPAGATA